MTLQLIFYIVIIYSDFRILIDRRGCGENKSGTPPPSSHTTRTHGVLSLLRYDTSVDLFILSYYILIFVSSLLDGVVVETNVGHPPPLLYYAHMRSFEFAYV